MPPEYVTQYLPVELLAVVAAVAAVWWGVSMVAKFVGRIRSTVRPWIEWLETFRSDWEGRPERTTPDGYVLHPAEPGVPQRLAVSDERIEGLTAAIAEHSEAIAEIRYNVKGISGHSAWDAMAEKLDTNTKLLHELRGIVHQVAMRQSTQSNDLQDLREDYRRALEHNHPDYNPEA